MAFYKIIASTIGTDAGPFTITTNTGVVLATGVTRLQMLAGYTFDVPVGVVSVTVSNEPSSACTTNEVFVISGQGFWEMQKSGVEAISDHYGVLVANYTVPVESFAADNVVGVYSGIVSGTGTWTIKGGPEAILGTTYNGGGTLITTKSNTNTLTTVESGATFQLGLDINALTGSATGTVTVNAGGFANVVGANEPTGRNVFSTLVNNGNVNVTGPERCGEGYFRLASLDNRNIITIDHASFRPAAYAAGVGTILVNDGATLEIANTGIPSTQTIQLNGCGKCDMSGRDDGALLYGVAVHTIAAAIELQSPSCIKTLSGGLATFSGPITGNHKLTMDNKAGSSSASGSTSFTSATATFDNTLEVKNTTLYNTGTNALAKADIVLVGNGKMQQDGGVLNLGSLASTSETATILANSSVSLNLKENGVTTYAGTLGNSTPGTPWPFRLDGPDTNKITLTGSGGSATNLISADGSKIVAEGGTYNQWSSVNGGTISAGTAASTRINNLSMAATGALDVYARGTGVGLLWASNTASLAAGWKVNLMEPLPAGTFNILQKPNSVALTLPTLGTNLSGRTVVGFANTGSYITVTLA